MSFIRSAFRGSAFGIQLGVALEGDFDKEVEAARKRVSFAAVSAMKEVGEGLKDQLRADVAQGLNSTRMPTTWRGALYPNTGLDPAYFVHSKAPLIISAFERGEVIRSGRGAWLTIPNPELRLERVRPIGGSNRSRSVVARYEAKYGRLRFVPVKGRRDLALLVAKDWRGARGGPKKDVVVFYLVPQAKAPKLLQGAELRRRMGRDGPAKFQRAFDRYLAQADRFGTGAIPLPGPTGQIATI